MEVSTKSGTNIEWTEEAKLVIRKIVELDGCQRLQKAVLFEELYDLWTTDGLISEKIAITQFDKHSRFIYETIETICNCYRINTQYSQRWLNIYGCR